MKDETESEILNLRILSTEEQKIHKKVITEIKMREASPSKMKPKTGGPDDRA